MPPARPALDLHFVHDAGDGQVHRHEDLRQGLGCFAAADHEDQLPRAGLGGKGIVLFSGLVADVEAAVEIGVKALENPDLLVRQVVIPQLHPGMWENVADATRFRMRVVGQL